MSREGYKMTELGEIPQEWNICRVFDIRDKSDKYSFTGGPFGSNLKSCDYTEDGIRVIQLQNIGDGFFSNQYKIYTSQRKADELLSCNIYPGEIILAKMADPVARACIIPNDEKRYLMCSDGIRLKIDNNECDNRYIMYSINSEYFRKSAIANSTGSTRLRIGLNELKNLQLIIPPLKEQQKIADILSTVDQQIEQTDALIEKTKELKKGLMQRLLTKGIGHTEYRDTEIGRIPKGWEVKRLVEVSDINPESLSSKTDPNSVLKYIDIESVTTGKINGTKEFCFAEAPSRARRIVVYNDVIISTVRPYLKAFAIVKTDEDNMICSTGFAVIRAINNNNPEFLFQYTLSDCFINQLSNKMVGSNYPAVNASDVKESLIAVPPINEQKRIAQVLSEFDIQINELEDKKEKLCILKSGLMDKLLTGRVRVKI